MSRKMRLSGKRNTLIVGYFISLGLIERSKQHELLIKENQLLHQELLNCQDSL